MRDAFDIYRQGVLWFAFLVRRQLRQCPPPHSQELHRAAEEAALTF